MPMVLLVHLRSPFIHCIYCLGDIHSEYAHFTPLYNSVTADGVAQIFMNNLWKLQDVPKSISEDRKPKLVSDFWREFVVRLKINRNMTCRDLLAYAVTTIDP